MSEIQTLQSLAVKITDADRVKFDRVFDEVIFPRMKKIAEEYKRSEMQIGSFLSHESDNAVVKQLFGSGNLQRLVETKMKPYLEEKGFKVVICSPSYYVYIRW